MADEETPRYQRRLVLFIDFLGFSEIVEGTSKKPPELVKLIKAMDELRTINRERSVLKRVTHFSDSIVVSYLVNKPAAAFSLLSGIAYGVITMVERGYLLRGAVTVGDLYHSREHVVGPAMVRAYRMEKDEAIYPRVIIDPKIFREAWRHPYETNSPEEEEESVRSYATKDEDGLYYYDYVAWDSVVRVTGGTNDYYPKYLRKLGGLIEAGLKHSDPRIQHKYLWLHPKYVEAIRLAESVPSDGPYRRENPGWCEEIVTLPKFEEIARSATKLVEAWRAKGGRKS